MATRRRSSAPSTRNRVLFVGWGVLGKATAKFFTERWIPDEDIDTPCPTIDIVDPSLESNPRMKLRSAGQDVKLNLLKPEIDWHELTSKARYSAVFVCIPTTELDEWITDNEALFNHTLVIVRTTMELSKIPDYETACPNLVYFPEYAREQEMRFYSVTDNELVYVPNKRVQSKFVNLMGNVPYRFTFTNSLQATAAHKLLHNAWLATIFTFKNDAARIYRAYNIKKPLEIPFGMLADQVNTNPTEAAISVSGKCLPDSLKYLSQATAEFSFFADVRDYNENAVGRLARRVNRQMHATAVFSKNRKPDQEWFRLQVLGLSPVKGDPSGPIGNGQSLEFLKQCPRAVASPFNYPAQLEELGLKAKSLKHLVSRDIYGTAVIVLQDFPGMIAAISAQIKANVTMRHNRLQVFDPLHLITPSQWKFLRAHAGVVGGTKRVFDLTHHINF